MSQAKDLGDDSIHVEQANVTTQTPNVSAASNGDEITKKTADRKDVAAQFLKEANRQIIVTPEDNKRVLSKIDWHILPIIMTVYCLQSLDKTTLSYASVFGLSEHTHLKGDQYSWLGSVVYVAQLVFQPLIAYFLVKFSIGKFSSIMVFCWGAVLCCMAASHNFTGLLVTRLLLGAFEASVAPTFLAVVQMWYRRAEQTKRNAFWYAMLGLPNSLGSLLAFGLAHIPSSTLKPYQIIFLFCGAITVVFSIVMFFFMPDSPITAKFLSQDDKLIAVERIRMNQQGLSSGVWKWDHVADALFRDPKTWLWFSLIFLISIPSGGISTFGPLIIKSFGFDSFTTILFNIPFGVVQIVATLGGAYFADKIRMKSPVLLLLCLPPIAGCSILLAVGRASSDRAVLLAGYYIISFYPGISPLIYSWSSQNTGGDTKRKVTTAVLFVGQSAGNIIGPLLFRTNEKPYYHRGLRANLIIFVALAVAVILGMLLIKILNKRQGAKRIALGKPEHIVDLSMMDRSAATGEQQEEMMDEHVGDHAFDDVTDLRNEDFIYVY